MSGWSARFSTGDSSQVLQGIRRLPAIRADLARRIFRGFDVAADHSGMGLANLQQRASDVGGDLARQSSSAGTTVTLVLPVN